MSSSREPRRATCRPALVNAALVGLGTFLLEGFQIGFCLVQGVLEMQLDGLALAAGDTVPEFPQPAGVAMGPIELAAAVKDGGDQLVDAASEAEFHGDFLRRPSSHEGHSRYPVYQRVPGYNCGSRGWAMPSRSRVSAVRPCPAPWRATGGDGISPRLQGLMSTP